MKYLNILILLLSFVVVRGQNVPDRLFDTQMEELAGIFAELTRSDPAFNDLVKTRTALRFDGDYNFLINPALRLPLTDGQTLESKIRQETENEDALIGFIQGHPRLQLAIPVDFESWNGVNALPVSWFTAQLNESTDTRIACIFPDGQRGWLSLLIEPDYPVLVLSINERTDAQGNLLPVLGSGDGGGGDDNGDDDWDDWDDDPCYGPDGAWQYLENMNCLNLNAIEHWISGAPEVQFIFKKENNQSLLNGEWGTIIVPPKRKDVDNTWFNIGATLFRWSQDGGGGLPAIGPYCFVFVNERDNGTLVNLPISVEVTTPAGISVSVDLTVHITDKDEIIGTLPAYFIDCNHFTYNPGILKFRMYRQ
ncbi:MAG: hypothetical protein GYB31_15205 [Bacteroidetes bacterium]|nr:hypothetical protein [Bacteroidota bacterium]